MIYFFGFKHQFDNCESFLFRFGINVLLIGHGHFYVPMEPFSTRNFSHVFGGLILTVQQLKAFTV